MVTHVSETSGRDRRSVMHRLALAFSLAVAAVAHHYSGSHVDP